MEELKTSEALDREILEDARKKAHRILKTADDSLASQTKIWDKKIQDSLDSLQKTYADKTKRSAEEILARLPLDKLRLRSETAEGFLVRSMDDFLRGLSREQLLSILEIELSERLVVFFEDGSADSESAVPAKPELLYSGMSASEISDVLKKILSAPAFTAGAPCKMENWELKEDRRVHEFPSVVINTPSQKITASVEKAAQALLLDKRAELASALLGEGVLNY